MSPKTETNIMVFMACFLVGLLATPPAMMIYKHHTEPVRVSYGTSFYTGVLVTHHAPANAEENIGITMPCGSKFRLHKGEPFPANDISCPCGDTNHWLFQRK